ncbi:hypothetical protein BKA64DRAFT_714640 [Cadophora sp. MPI-SDFR-AT-0126]|nr:hypothetical protein BKA64DRAFT_714640 [Leotiomycetes sp. MPI-SDFR-AT-0126]
MSSIETERFLKRWSATVPLPQGSGEGNLIGYDKICKSVESYLRSIRAENAELAVELRLSEEMQLYQARQTAVLEFWGLTAHTTFPPPPESAAATYQAAALYRINILAATLDRDPDINLPLRQTHQGQSSRQVADPITPTRSPIRISFRKPPTSIKARSYRKHNSTYGDKQKQQHTESLQRVEGQRSPATPSTPSTPSAPTKASANTKTPPNPPSCVRIEAQKASKASPSRAAGTYLAPQASEATPAGLLSTVIGVVAYRSPVSPIWPGIKLQDDWDYLTGFPSGSFVFSTPKAFPRIVGPITNGVGAILGRVNEMFPLLRLRWERTPVKGDGRKDLAVWVDFGIGISRTDPEALRQKEVMLKGLREFHHRDLESSHSYFSTYFEQNIERLRAEPLAIIKVLSVSN